MLNYLFVLTTDFYFRNIIKVFNILMSHDNAFSRHVIADLDTKLEGRKPIEQIKDDIAELKVEMIHIKNYLRKLEIREQLKEEEDKKKEAEYEKVTKSSWW